jgi:hypothetical protein
MITWVPFCGRPLRGVPAADSMVIRLVFLQNEQLRRIIELGPNISLAMEEIELPRKVVTVTLILSRQALHTDIPSNENAVPLDGRIVMFPSVGLCATFGRLLTRP